MPPAPMHFHTTPLQPRNGSPSWPTGAPPVAPTPDTPAPPAPAAQPAWPANTAPATTTTEVPAGTAGYASQEMCQRANHDALISAGGYAFGASLLGMVIFLVMRKKLWLSSFGRYMTAILVACAVGLTLALWDPVRADDLTLCLNAADFKQYVFLGGQLFARALVLGLVPSFLVTLLGCFVANRT
jgi:hypothetical protein